MLLSYFLFLLSFLSPTPKLITYSNSLYWFSNFLTDLCLFSHKFIHLYYLGVIFFVLYFGLTWHFWINQNCLVFIGFSTDICRFGIISLKYLIFSSVIYTFMEFKCIYLLSNSFFCCLFIHYILKVTSRKYWFLLE